MSESTNGFDAETRARIDCAEQFDETGTHLSDCPLAHPQEGGATGMSEPTLASQFCAHLHVEWHTRDDGNLTVGWWECAVCPQHFVPFTEDLIRTVAALTAENERLTRAQRDHFTLREELRIACETGMRLNLPAEQIVARVRDSLGADAARFAIRDRESRAALPSSREDDRWPD